LEKSAPSTTYPHCLFRAAITFIARFAPHLPLYLALANQGQESAFKRVDHFLSALVSALPSKRGKIMFGSVQKK
jgi:hypothetical protein